MTSSQGLHRFQDSRPGLRILVLGTNIPRCLGVLGLDTVAVCLAVERVGHLVVWPPVELIVGTVIEKRCVPINECLIDPDTLKGEKLLTITGERSGIPGLPAEARLEPTSGTASVYPKTGVLTSPISKTL